MDKRVAIVTGASKGIGKAISQSLAAAGRPLVGRNFDLRLPNPERLLVYTTPRAGHAHAGMAGPSGRADGVNAAGLVVGTTEAQVKPGLAQAAAAPGALPVHVVTRIVLERCATTAAAVDLLVGLAQWTRTNYLVADAAGAAAVVEVGVGRTAVRYPGKAGEGPWLVATNHFVAPELRDQADYRWLTRQKYRATVAGLTAAANGGRLAPADCGRVLAGRGVAQRHITLWSEVFEPGGPWFWLAPARPDRNPFVRVPGPVADRPPAGPGPADWAVKG